MPWKATSASALLSEETPESQEHRNAREIAQARLEWQTRAGNSLSLTVRWRRFFATHQFQKRELETLARSLMQRIGFLQAATEYPDRWTTANTWTTAMMMIESLDAELSAVRACLRDGGTE